MKRVLLPAWTNGIILLGLGLILLMAGAFWLITARNSALPLPAEAISLSPTVTLQDTILPSGIIAAMDSPAIAYSSGWRVTPQGADPSEPPDPWREPAGSFEFTFQGQTLALALAKGDYWGYLYVSVDGLPANRMAHVPGNRDSRDMDAGYTTLYAPDQNTSKQNAPEQVQSQTQWFVVHTSPEIATHIVRVEVWRSWGQMPVRGIAVDAVAAPVPMWPGGLLALLGLMLTGIWGWQLPRPIASVMPIRRFAQSLPGNLPPVMRRIGLFNYTLSPLAALLAVTGILLIALAIWLNLWWHAWLGLALLATATLWHPVYWLAALAAGLPFYYGVTLPLLPQRDFGLLDIGLGLGLIVMLLYRSLHEWMHRSMPTPSTPSAAMPPDARSTRRHPILLWLLIGWALISTLAAPHLSQALYEWRTVFLAAGMWWLLLRWSFPQTDAAARTLLIGGWLLGATLMALIALGQYMGDAMLITAEGVSRVRGLYGSPNNLALYLERTLLVSLGLALYLPARLGLRATLWAVALLQLAALLLTFSKGALLVGAPAGFAILWLAGLIILPRQNRSRRPLWALLGLAIVAALALVPFLGTERFRNVFDLTSGTGFLRVQLWRSSIAMGLDHPWLGVGPDNFLYAFRSHYLLPVAWQEPDLNHPHNLLLDGWTRLGLPGLALLLAWLGWGATGIWQRLKEATASPMQQALAAGCLAAIGAGLAHGLLDVSYALPDLMLVWVLLFHIPHIGRGDKREIEEHPIDAEVAEQRVARQTQQPPHQV